MEYEWNEGQHTAPKDGSIIEVWSEEMEVPAFVSYQAPTENDDSEYWLCADPFLKGLDIYRFTHWRKLELPQ